MASKQSVELTDIVGEPESLEIKTKQVKDGISKTCWCKALIMLAAVVVGAVTAIIIIFVSFSSAKIPQGIMSKKTAPYGSWVSPITSQLITKDIIRISSPLLVDPVNRDTIYWVESRPSEGGRSVVCSWKPGDKSFTSWTKAPFNVRTRVHEYGGGAFLVYNRTVYFSDFADQRLYVQKSPSSAPEAMTPEGSGWRFADGQYLSMVSQGTEEQKNRIFIIREDHSVVARNESKEPENTVVVINPETQQQTVLARGANFYSRPRASMDGKKLCWFQWNHPDMPWDSTELWVADLNETLDGLVPDSAKMVAGGVNVSVTEPSWTPNNTLLYVGDQTDWWNLYHITEDGQDVNLAPQQHEISGPHWNFGIYSYALDPRDEKLGKIATLFSKSLQLLDTSSGKLAAVDTGYQHTMSLQFANDGYVYCNVGSPDKASAIIRVHLTSGRVDVIRESTGLLHTIDKGFFSSPLEVKYPTSDNEYAFAYYYPPQNKDFEAPAGALPPLLVKVHGGPTGQSFPILDLTYHYFTSRGFGILDLNYRGSTGYGRQYRHRLYGNWGVLDIEDAAHGAYYIADTGKADREKLCIDGGSAGGYTTLASLTFKSGVFKAGSSSYGIGDLELLAQETHKFESRYLDKVIGPYPELKEVYKQRSPINHLDNFNTPCIFFQGDEDQVVPPNQAVLMFNKLKSKGVTTALVMFQGEQHGFRKAENIQKALDGEFYFYSKVYGFDTPGLNVSIPIANLPKKESDSSENETDD